MSQVIESKKIADILNYVDDETLLILDVDNTLIEPVNYVGGSTWFLHMLKSFASRGIGESEAVKSIYPLFVQLQYVIKIKTVELETCDVVKQAQKIGAKTLALTWRGDILVTRTVEQLAAIGINLGKQTIHDKELFVEKTFGFTDGVLSVNPGNDKGSSLKKFLHMVDYVPNKILIVDDSAMFVEDVRSTLEQEKIPFTCIRYGGADARHIKFNPATAAGELRSLLEGTEHDKLIGMML